MDNWLKINGTDFNLTEVSASLDEFKEVHKSGFAKGMKEDELREIHKTLRKGVNHPDMIESLGDNATTETTTDGNSKGNEATGVKSQGAGNSTGTKGTK